MSSALKINKLDYVKNVKEYKGPFKHIKFYFDSGSDSLDTKLKPGTLEMIDVLKNKGYKINKNIFWFEDKEGRHNEASWAKRVNLPLKLFVGKSKIHAKSQRTLRK